MSIRFNDDYKEELVDHLSSAVKQIQIEYISAEADGDIKPCITNNSPGGRILFSCLEMIFCHGLKRQDLGIWHAVEYFCRNDVKRTINNLVHVKSSRGKSRAWIYLTLNERELEGYFQSFQTNLHHFYKFYARSALVCSSQASLLQTLISGLDWVVFNLELDVPYLDYSIMCGKNWQKDRSSKTTKMKAPTDRGSVVHIDTKSIAEVGHKAVGLIKGLMSHENSSSSKSIENIDSTMLVAANSNQRSVPRKKYCPDCGTPNELICLCVAKEREPPQTLPSKNVEILHTVFQSKESVKDTSSIIKGARVNPFDSAYADKEEIEMTARQKRFNVHVAVMDTPIKVKRKPRKRRKKFSDTSVCSIKSEEAHSTVDKVNELTSSFQKCSSHGDICLSNPLIGFDPGSEESSGCSSEFSLVNMDGAHDENLVFIEADVETNTKNFNATGCSEDNDLTHEINTLDTECVLSYQNHSIDNPNIDILSLSEQFTDVADLLPTNPNMESCSTHIETSGVTEIASNDNSASEEVEGFEEQVIEEPNDVEDERIIEPMREKQASHLARNSSIDSETGSQLSTPIGSCSNLVMSSQSTPIKRTANDLALSSDCEERMTERSKKKNETRAREKDVRLMSPEEKKDVRKMKSARRYRSQSEKLLEDLTKLEVERLRAEIEARLKPSRDKLEKVQKYILERTTSSETDSTTTENTIASNSDAESKDKSTSDTPFANDESLSSDTASAVRPSQDVTGSMLSKVTPNFKAVADINNTLKLYLMLEILVNENEEILKMFHLSTGHSEGNWTALYLLFTDSCIYFLRSGDGNCPYQPEHIVPYEEMDYASVGSHDQTIEFVFYKTKKVVKPRKQPPSKYRAKVLVDSGDADLTNFLISTLSEAVATHTRRWGSVKVCPPVFRDAREHEISLVKYLRSEGLTGDIQYYQLVHWEDPDFVKGASVGKVSVQGTLKYKVHSFWGSSTKSAYFLLSGGILYQYANREREKPDCSYELTGGKCSGCQRIKSAETAQSGGLDFVIDFQDDSKLELSGFSVMEVTEWLQCLCMIVSLDQSSRIDQQACTDGIVMNMLNHDALVPCSLIIADETLLLCHEDHHTGFCRTLATAKREDIQAINIDRTGSIMCELVVDKNTNMSQTTKWGIFFSRRELLQAFLNIVDSFSKAPSLCDKDGDVDLTHYLEARALLDSRWTRTDNLLKGRSAGSESYTFV